MPAIIVVYIALSIAGIALALAGAKDVAGVAYLFVSALPVVAIPMGVAMFKPRSPWPWLLLASGQALFMLGDVIWTIDFIDGGAAYPTVADITYLAGYPLHGIALLQFVRLRRPRYQLVPTIDAFAVGIAGAMVLWLLLIEQFVHDPSLILLDKIALMAYPTADVLLVAAATFMVFANRGLRSGSQRLLAGAILLLFMADWQYTTLLIGPGYERGLIDAAWLGSYVMVGLAALVPSMRKLTEADSGANEMHPAWRLVVPVLAFTAVPAFAVVQLTAHGHVDVDFVVVVQVILAGLLVLRLYDMARTGLAEQRRHAALIARGSSAYMVVSPGGIVTYTSAQSAGKLRLTGGDPVGHPIRSLLQEAATDRVKADKFLDSVARPGSSGSTTLELRTEAGPVRRMRVSASNQTNIRTINATIIDYHDVTEQDAAMRRLREQAGILANIRESVIVSDLDGRVTHWNEGATQIFGYSAEEMIGQNVARLYPEVDSELAQSQLSAILAGQDYHGDWEGRRKDGSMLTIDAHTSPMFDADGAITGFIGVSTDVTAQRTDQRRIRRLATAIEQSSEAVLITGRDGTIEYVNPAFEKMTGYRLSEVLGGNPRLLKSGEQSGAFYTAMWDTLRSGEPWVADMVNRRKGGGLYQSETVISPIRDQDGTVDGYVAVSRDVTSERSLEQRAERLMRERSLVAQTLRGLDLNATPEETASRICRQVASLSDVDFACLYVFSQGDKAEPYGFVLANGDTAPLHPLPRGRSDYLHARGELGPWIESWHGEAAHPYRELFDKLGIRACAYAPIREGGAILGLLIVGSSTAKADTVLSTSLPALLEFADISAAQIGTSIVQRAKRQAARQEIERIIRRREFSIAFQPIVDLEAGRVAGFEALARFNDGVAPDVRIAEAASVGKDLDLELALMRAAVASAARLPNGAWLNLNASPAVVMDRRVAPVLALTDRPIVLEVTEHSEVSDYAAFRRAAESLGERVRLAIDDAGAGFASLRHIIEIRPAMVKLDRTLIQNLADDSARKALVAGLSHFAASSGFDVLAEGVETEAELAALRELDVRLVQGYLVGRPMTVEAAAAFTMPECLLTAADDRLDTSVAPEPAPQAGPVALPPRRVGTLSRNHDVIERVRDRRLAQLSGRGAGRAAK